jgi:hypothetical protein
MKKKMKWILIMLTIMVALVLLLLPSDVEVTVRVPLPLERVMAEFETMERVKKWLNTADSGYTITIEKANPFEFIFIHEKSGKNTPLRFVVSPDTADSKITKIIYRYSDGIFMGEDGKLKAEVALSVRQLSDSLSSTSYVYGYNIKETTVTDSSFLFQQKVVNRTEEQVATQQLFDELLAYAAKRGAGYNGVRIFYSQTMPDNRVALLGSIGVNIYTPTRPDENIQYKMMPYGKKLLIMDYEGPYGKTKELYSVLEEFKRNNNLVSMAIPFQKFLSEGYGFADSQVVKTRISYPVF